MDVRSYGAQSGNAGADAVRQAAQAVTDAAARSKVKRTGFGFKLGKLGVHYSSERVDIEHGRAQGGSGGDTRAGNAATVSSSASQSGVSHSNASQSVVFQANAARSSGAKAAATPLDPRTRRARAMYEQARARAFGQAQTGSEPSAQDGEVAESVSPDEFRRRRSLRQALGAYLETEGQLERREFEPKLLAVV